MNYPDINALNETECRQAINLAEINLFAVGREHQAGLLARLAALRERLRRLEWAKRVHLAH